MMNFFGQIICDSHSHDIQNGMQNDRDPSTNCFPNNHGSVSRNTIRFRVKEIIYDISG